MNYHPIPMIIPILALVNIELTKIAFPNSVMQYNHNHNHTTRNAESLAIYKTMKLKSSEVKVKTMK